jgi:hypothetical protein
MVFHPRGNGKMQSQPVFSGLVPMFHVVPSPQPALLRDGLRSPKALASIWPGLRATKVSKSYYDIVLARLVAHQDDHLHACQFMNLDGLYSCQGIRKASSLGGVTCPRPIGL